MSDYATPALVGELVVVLLVVGLVWLLFREFVRVALKVVVPAGILMALAVWTGLLDRTVAGDVLATVGDSVLTGIRAVADWARSAATRG